MIPPPTAGLDSPALSGTKRATLRASSIDRSNLGTIYSLLRGGRAGAEGVDDFALNIDKLVCVALG